ncbi:glycosyltransferase [Limimaricola variabilis]|uniref:glycosyltransferase family protein n=1 Tax=Limimaricola variabilis TaxID=1492771 RepID=UPI002AC8A5A4|nr:glycosyltransferase [Limimaricola variabilis]WPY95384.1 glycosyltransferase [Limimaricola variabilis]
MTPGPAAAGGKKPLLVFFQWNHRPNARASGFLEQHARLHVKCLAHDFEVEVISEDCDYREVCDRFEPDLALFEAGYRTHGSTRPRITGTDAHPGIPKIALHNGDPWCDRRAGLLADMDGWGIETVFAIGTATPGYTPSLAGRCYVWPNFIDPAVFRHYGLEKVVPVTLTGQVYGLYPWRQAVHELLAERYVCLVTPPFRYEDAAARRMLAGEAYARALNASWLSPSCGTMGHELVRKHLEIPGAGCLLVTERIPVLEAAGFLDGVNCVFADPPELVDKVDALLAEPERMSEIIAGGHALVHARHTLAHRPQIRQWFDLSRDLKDGARIAQEDVFGPLRVATAEEGMVGLRLPTTGLDRAALRRAEQCLARGRVDEARAAFEAALDYVAYLPEARFGLARCDLAQGRATAALDRLSALIATTLKDYGAERPDPVEWAYYLAALLAAGHREAAIGLRSAYPELDHAELRLMRAALDRLADRPVGPWSVAARPATSLHALPARTPEMHGAWLVAIQSLNGQPPSGGRRGAGLRLRWQGLAALDRALRRLPGGVIRPRVPPAPGFGYLAELRDAVGRWLLPPLVRRRLRALGMRAAEMSRHGPRIRRSRS